MSNPGVSGTSLPNTDSVHHSGVVVDTSPLPANSSISAPMTSPESPQIPFETASSGLVSDSSLPVQPKSSTRGRGSGGGNRGSNSSAGRKRGRPRKFGPEHALPSSMSVEKEQVTKSQPNSSVSTLPTLPAPPNYISAPLPPPAKPSSPSPSSSAKKPRGRGRPPGSGRKQPTCGSSAPIGPIPTITRPDQRIGVTACDIDMKAIFVSPGEDVVEKLTTFAQQDNKGIFIASAFGSVSSATLRPPTASTGSTTYEGVFQITSLSGSLLQSITHGQRTWIGGLSVSLTGQDNHSHVGGVAGSMIAATPVQIIVCSFNLEDEDKSKPPGRVNHVNVTETTGKTPAANGAVNKSGSGGGGGVSGASIPDNSGT